jgi:hypothetical protein
MELVPTFLIKDEKINIGEYHYIPTFIANEKNILDDSVYFYDYVNKVLGIEQKNIILFGRSMGTGPASYLASMYSCFCLLLISPYISIKDVSKDVLGWASFLSSIV